MMITARHQERLGGGVTPDNAAQALIISAARLNLSIVELGVALVVALHCSAGEEMYGEGPEFEVLFWTGDGMAARQNQVALAGREVDAASEAHIKSKSDDEIVNGAIEKFGTKVPTLDRDNISFERKARTVISENRWGERYERQVVVFYFDVPFSGEADIFKLRPNQYNSNPPRGQVYGSILRVSVSGEEDPEKLKAEVNSTLDDVELYLRWHGAMWAGIEDDLAREVRAKLSQRRDRLSKLGATEEGLAGLGFKPK